jgi:hypothetical protein
MRTLRLSTALPGLLAACTLDRAGLRDPGAGAPVDASRWFDAASTDASGRVEDAAPVDAPGSRCGDGVREGAEACDGADLGKASCASEGFARGVLGCTPECRLETVDCRNPPPNWHDAACPYRVALTVPAGLVTGAWSAFPLLVAHTIPGLRDHALDGGGDLVFASQDGTQRLPHEAERFDADTGALFAWVALPALEGSTGTTVYLYYGAEGCGASRPNDPTAVWDEHFRGVWHLAEAGVGERRDSTRAARAAAPAGYEGDEAVDGRIAGGDAMDGMNDHLVLPSAATRDLTTFTMCLWIRTGETRSNGTAWRNPTLIGQITTGYQSGDVGILSESGRVGLRSGLCAGIDELRVSGTTIADDTWHHVCAVSDAATVALHVDGTQVAQVCAGGRAVDPQAFWVGGQSGEAAGEAGAFHQGRFDEVQISDVARAPGWLQASHRNQRDPEAFVAIGPEEAL